MNLINDALKDIVQHTHSLGIDLVKVTGTPKETLVNAMAEDRSVVVEAQFKSPIVEFNGTFGMPSLGRLNTILNIPEYREKATVTVMTQLKDNEKVPVGVKFVNASNDFKNEYRFMSSEIVNEKLKAVKFKGVKWDIEFVPMSSAIQRLKFQASASNEETTFAAKTENGNLVFHFGDVSGHAGNFVFQSNVTGVLSHKWDWPVVSVLSILGLPGSKMFRISNEGAAEITVDSGLAEYRYLIPAQRK